MTATQQLFTLHIFSSGANLIGFTQNEDHYAINYNQSVQFATRIQKDNVDTYTQLQAVRSLLKVVEKERVNCIFASDLSANFMFPILAIREGRRFIDFEISKLKGVVLRDWVLQHWVWSEHAQEKWVWCAGVPVGLLTILMDLCSQHHIHLYSVKTEETCPAYLPLLSQKNNDYDIFVSLALGLHSSKQKYLELLPFKDKAKLFIFRHASFVLWALAFCNVVLLSIFFAIYTYSIAYKKNLIDVQREVNLLEARKAIIEKDTKRVCQLKKILQENINFNLAKTYWVDALNELQGILNEVGDMYLETLIPIKEEKEVIHLAIVGKLFIGNKQEQKPECKLETWIELLEKSKNFTIAAKPKINLNEEPFLKLEMVLYLKKISF